MLDSLEKRRDSLENLPQYRQTDTPFVDAPDPEDKAPTKHAMPAKHTAPCLGRRANQVTVLSLHCVISLCSLAGGIQTLVIDDSTDSTYSGTILIVSSVVWAWATVVLLIAPASASCSVPIFWALAFYAEVVTGWLSGCAFWDQHHRGLQVTEAGSTFSMLVLVLLSWRQFAGLTLLPVLLMLLVCQAFIGLVQMISRRCPSSEPEAGASQLGKYAEPLMQSEDTVLADGETVVELMIYDLWPSWLPLYVGRYMGAYHTGIAAYNKPGSDVGPLEYTFECPHGVVARKKGKRPSYVQGDNCTTLHLGKCSVDLFNDCITMLRASERYSDGGRYGILSNNCHDFCVTLIQELDLPVQVPMYAQSLDKVVAFFVPGGSLQTLEKFFVQLEGPCESSTIAKLVLCSLGFAFCIVVPMALVISNNM